eukprot:scaffold17185_cov56-Attheya_sp.AAC.2
MSTPRSLIKRGLVFKFISLASLRALPHAIASPARFPESVLELSGGGANRRNMSHSKDGEFPIGGGSINEKERFYDSKVKRKIVGHERTPSSVIVDRDDGDASIPPLEKISQFDPSHSLAHMLHAMVGLERYPNYLSRWQMGDVDKLEAALQDQLAEVQRQKSAIGERRAGLEQLVKKAVGENAKMLNPPVSWYEVRENILNPRAAKAIFESKFFSRKKDGECPTIEQVLTGETTVELDPGMMENWLDQEMFDVYSMDLLSQEFCLELKGFVRKVVALGETEEFVHLNIGRRSVDLDTIGLGWINDLLFHLVMRPISRLLYVSTESMDELDWRQGYVAGYSVDPAAVRGAPRQRLVSHTDDSEVTLNLCIGDEFEGGALQFRGLRGTDEEGELLGEFQPQLGTALLHAGRHLHEVTNVESGDRYAFIIWARSWKGVRAQSCPCCWLNRRDDTRCICGPSWN